MLKVYDMSKGGTDISDQRVDSYTCSTKSPKWTRKVFCYKIDHTRINAQTVFALLSGLDPRKTNSFKFAWNLVKQLVGPHMLERRRAPGLQTYIVSKIDMFLSGAGFLPAPAVPLGPVPAPVQVDGQGQNHIPGAAVQQDHQVAGNIFLHSNVGEQRRCSECLKGLPSGQNSGRKAAKDKLSKPNYQCQMCADSVCIHHYVLVCQPCSDKLTVKTATGAEELGGVLFFIFLEIFFCLFDSFQMTFILTIFPFDTNLYE
jgi:hypothetical protein